jgi:glycerophosphoryl diester phosphodiesterase
VNAVHPGRLPYLHHKVSGRLSGWPLAFAHRGFAPDGAENTLAAFRNAVALGYRYLELDVRTTHDGVLVVFHDERLDRVTDGAGRLDEHSYAQVRALRVAGREPIPTFDEVLEEWPDVHLNVDIKDTASAVLLARSLDRHAAHDRVLVASFADARRRGLLRTLGRPIASSSGAASIALLTVLGPLGLARLVGPRLHDVVALQVPVRRGPVRVITPGFIRRAHAHGMQVHAWVVNEPAEMERLLAMGVDGIMTDRADVLARLLEQRGFWPQRPMADR